MARRCVIWELISPGWSGHERNVEGNVEASKVHTTAGVSDHGEIDQGNGCISAVQHDRQQMGADGMFLAPKMRRVVAESGAGDTSFFPGGMQHWQSREVSYCSVNNLRGSRIPTLAKQRCQVQTSAPTIVFPGFSARTSKWNIGRRVPPPAQPFAS